MDVDKCVIQITPQKFTEHPRGEERMLSRPYSLFLFPSPSLSFTYASMNQKKGVKTLRKQAIKYSLALHLLFILNPWSATHHYTQLKTPRISY